MLPDHPFHQALLANPDDDTLRLVIADWLEENDQPARAEFIRVQIELARGVAELDRRRHLEQRQRELLLTHEADWVQPLAEVLDCPQGKWGGWVFRRGFVEYFHLPASVVNRHGERLAQLTPVRELFLRPCNSGNVLGLCRRPWLRSITALYLHAHLNANAIRALIDCPYLENLRVLDVLTGDVPDPLAREFRRRFGHQLVRRRR
jgi:uncharacterized protein (TIGR02996 family)